MKNLFLLALFIIAFVNNNFATTLKLKIIDEQTKSFLQDVSIGGIFKNTNKKKYETVYHAKKQKYLSKKNMITASVGFILGPGSRTKPYDDKSGIGTVFGFKYSRKLSNNNSYYISLGYNSAEILKTNFFGPDMARTINHSVDFTLKNRINEKSYRVNFYRVLHLGINRETTKWRDIDGWFNIWNKSIPDTLSGTDIVNNFVIGGVFEVEVLLLYDFNLSISLYTDYNIPIYARRKDVYNSEMINREEIKLDYESGFSFGLNIGLGYSF